MSILVNRNDRIIVQGITGLVGGNFARRALQYGTPVVGGVTPGKGGQKVEGLPVFNSVYQAKAALGATASWIAVPAPFVKDAVLEAADAGVGLMVVYTEHTPIHDTLEMVSFTRARGCVLLGPNSAGCVTPGQANLADINEVNLVPGRVGIVSKSGTLSYEVFDRLHRVGLGESTVVCIGGDPIVGNDHSEILERFEADPDTDAVVMVGEIGGKAEIRAAEVIRRMTKPVVVFIAGRWAPKGKRMGHAGAIISRDQDTAAAKTAILAEAGAIIAEQVTDTGALVAKALKDRGQARV